MTERGIIMDADSVRGILDGIKTQTRRVIKPQPPGDVVDVVQDDGGQWGLVMHCYEPGEFYFEPIKCPYGVPGDTLWVRETWATDRAFDDQKPSEIPQHIAEDEIFYFADGHLEPEWLGRKRPSIYMCRWMSRILLEVVDIRVERLWEIERDDILAEGLDIAHLSGGEFLHAWTERWNSINAERGFGWDTNPWVWVVEFEEVRDEQGA